MLLKRHLDLYTIGDPLELKSKFWSWYMRALRGHVDWSAIPNAEDRKPRLPPKGHDAMVPESTSLWDHPRPRSQRRPGVRFQDPNTLMPKRARPQESHDNHPVLPGSAYYTYGPPAHSGLPVRDRYGDPRRPPLGFFATDYPPSKFSAGANPARDPWWWSFPELRPYHTPHMPLRNFIPGHSYLSPIKRNYVWSPRPHRPYSYRCYY